MSLGYLAAHQPVSSVSIRKSSTMMKNACRCHVPALRGLSRARSSIKQCCTMDATLAKFSVLLGPLNVRASAVSTVSLLLNHHLLGPKATRASFLGVRLHYNDSTLCIRWWCSSSFQAFRCHSRISSVLVSTIEMLTAHYYALGTPATFLRDGRSATFLVRRFLLLYFDRSDLSGLLAQTSSLRL